MLSSKIFILPKRYYRVDQKFLSFNFFNTIKEDYNIFSILLYYLTQFFYFTLNFELKRAQKIIYSKPVRNSENLKEKPLCVY